MSVMEPITSAPNCFIKGKDKLYPVRKLNGEGEYVETGVEMQVSDSVLNKVPWRLEDVSIDDAFAAADRVRGWFPGMKVQVKDGSVVTSHSNGIPAIGTANTSIFVVIGGLVALAPQWILLCNSAYEPGKLTQASDVEGTVSKLRPGIWGEILDAR